MRTRPRMACVWSLNAPVPRFPYYEIKVKTMGLLGRLSVNISKVPFLCLLQEKLRLEIAR